MAERTRPSIAVIVVTYNTGEHIAALLDSVLPQLSDDDQLIIVDNASLDDTPTLIESLAPSATLLESGSNLGFAGGVNYGVEHAAGDLLLLLNPDLVVADGCLDALRCTSEREPDWGCWQAMVTLPGGHEVNTAGGRVHGLGFGWSGGWCEPVARHAEPTEVGFASGAAFCIRRALWNQLGGFDPHYFMYCEDLDLSLRARLAGWRVGVEPLAVVEHDYEFDKGPDKWFYLERNRWATILGTYPTALLLYVLPMLLVFELALVPIAIKGRWFGSKRRAMIAVIRDLPRNWRRRQVVQRARTISARDFAMALTDELDGAFFASVPGWLQRPWQCYWRMVLRLV